MLESMHISSKGVGNAIMESLTITIANNIFLRELDFPGNRNVTPTGWQSLFQLLQHLSCRLECLKLSELIDQRVESLTDVICMAAR
jgi:hypothetical protein